jgi:hypothetical protein
MTVTEQLVKESELTEAQKLIYGRRRIVEAFYQSNPEKFKWLQATDIHALTLQDDLVACTLDDTDLYIPRSAVIQSFWDHRTRTPSFFSYKVWGQALTSMPWKGTPVGALDYGRSFVKDALEPVLGRAPQLATDKDGVQKLYFVDEKEGMCSCESWSQMHIHKEELKKEFEQFTDIKFAPICKHLQWQSSNMMLHALRFHSREQVAEYNPRLCVFHYDHARSLIQYRVTYDGAKAKGQWFPVEGWKEKPVHEANGMPTGNCWQVLTSALSQDPPFKLVPYSQAVAGIMNATRSR